MKKIAMHIPLMVITVLMIYCIYIVTTSYIMFSYEHYIGLFLILLSIVFLWYNLRISKLATFLALILGTFSQAAFTATISRIRLGFTIGGIGLDIVLQPYCLLLLIFFIIINWSFLSHELKRIPR